MPRLFQHWRFTQEFATRHNSSRGHRFKIAELAIHRIIEPALAIEQRHIAVAKIEQQIGRRFEGIAVIDVEKSIGMLQPRAAMHDERHAKTLQQRRPRIFNQRAGDNHRVYPGAAHRPPVNRLF